MEYDRQMAIKNDGDKKGAKKEMYDDQRRVLQKQIREKEELLAEAIQKLHSSGSMSDLFIVPNLA